MAHLTIITNNEKINEAQEKAFRLWTLDTTIRPGTIARMSDKVYSSIHPQLRSRNEHKHIKRLQQQTSVANSAHARHDTSWSEVRQKFFPNSRSTNFRFTARKAFSLPRYHRDPLSPSNVVIFECFDTSRGNIVDFCIYNMRFGLYIKYANIKKIELKSKY